jgi:hypothetical protein
MKHFWLHKWNTIKPERQHTALLKKETIKIEKEGEKMKRKRARDKDFWRVIRIIYHLI